MNNGAFNKLSNVDCDAYKNLESETPSHFDDLQYVVQGDWKDTMHTNPAAEELDDYS